MVAKSYMRTGFLIYEEIVIYEEAVSHNDFATAPFWVSLYMRKIFFLFQCIFWYFSQTFFFVIIF